MTPTSARESSPLDSEVSIPLHLAAHYGQLEIVRLLIQNGARLDALSENAEGNTPLMAAVAGGQIEIVDELLRAGADEEWLRTNVLRKEQMKV